MCIWFWFRFFHFVLALHRRRSNVSAHIHVSVCVFVCISSCWLLPTVHVTSYYLHRLRSIWRFFFKSSSVRMCEWVSEPASVCIIQTLTWALIFCKWEEIERQKKWIDYKNELFPTACDLPASVGLCAIRIHTHTNIRITRIRNRIGTRFHCPALSQREE